MPARLPVVTSLLLTAALLPATDAVTVADGLIEPGLRLAVIDTPHLHALVPADQATALAPLITRADAIYVQLARDADYAITRPLNLLVTDSVDTHNGYSFVTPYPLINIQLAPAQPSQSIFTGEPPFLRTFTHEVTHHISNDRSYGFRHALECVFGRIYPNDYLSALTAYLSTPAHQTMPSFWHEGLAQWAETHYADPASPWSGRGRDSITHMIWRMDAAAGAIPEADDWRLGFHRWPYGTLDYAYGLAYTRWLAGRYGDGILFPLADAQAHQWAFMFDDGSEDLLGRPHHELIAEARAELMAEQQRTLALIRAQPVTKTTRLTPEDWRVGAPAWTPDGRLFAALADPNGVPRFGYVDATGKIEWTSDHALTLGNARSTADGTIVYAETPSEGDQYSHSQIKCITTTTHSPEEWGGSRVIQPDVRRVQFDSTTKRYGYQLVGIRLLPGGQSELVMGWGMPAASLLERLHSLGWRDRCLPFHGSMLDSSDGEGRISCEGMPWSPTFRPGREEIYWIETDHLGSRLIRYELPHLAEHTEISPENSPLKKSWIEHLSHSKRTVLWQVKGRLLHPAWSADGRHLFVCSDHTGVANAYRLDPDKPGEATPVTNTENGVIACVPSFDGKELALVEHDHHGPYLARIPNDPATWPQTVPVIPLAWPAPVTSVSGVRGLGSGGRQPASASTNAPSTTAMTSSSTDGTPSQRQPTPDPRPQTPDPLISSYHGLAELRPLFWTPTTLPTPEGGYGVAGMASDPAQTHVIAVGAGVGLYDHSPVGSLGWAYLGWPIDLAAVAWQAETAYADQLLVAGRPALDYVESRASAELRAGFGLGGSTRRWQGWLAAGDAVVRETTASAERHEGFAVVNADPPFAGHERYVEATLAYDGRLFFPMSYSREDGPALALTARRSGFGGDLTGTSLRADGSNVFSVIPAWGQQLVLGGSLGWSDGDPGETLQGRFHTGGNTAYGQPRGYPSFMSTGSHLLGWTTAWRTPLWRPFAGHGTTPFVSRQAVLELFWEGAQTSTDRIGGNGRWLRSAGGEIRWSFSFWEQVLNPGLGLAKQIDGYQDTATYLTLDFRW